MSESPESRAAKLQVTIDVLEEMVPSHPPKLSDIATESARLSLASQIGKQELLARLKDELAQIKEAGS